MNENIQNTQEVIRNIFKNWRNIVIITLIFAILASIVTFSQPLKYGSTMRLLVVQEYSSLTDPFAASKSTQYLSDILSEVVYSTSFLNEVLNSGFSIEDNYSQNEQKRKKQWEKTVTAKPINDTGIIVITAYHTDRMQAEQIARAVSYTLRTKHTLYHGGGEKVSVRVIENAITSNWPVKPNIINNFVLALVFGVIFGSGFVYLFPGYKIRLWKRKREVVEYTEPEVLDEHDDGVESDDNYQSSNENLHTGQDYRGEIVDNRDEYNTNDTNRV